MVRSLGVFHVPIPNAIEHIAAADECVCASLGRVLDSERDKVGTQRLDVVWASSPIGCTHGSILPARHCILARCTLLLPKQRRIPYLRPNTRVTMASSKYGKNEDRRNGAGPRKHRPTGIRP